MARACRLSLYAAAGAFAAWLLFSLRADLAAISFSSLWQAWDLVLLALVLSFLNYTLRFFRWHWYLRRLGHSPPLGASSLAYASGFAYTLSPAKVGELIRARFYSREQVPTSVIVGAFFVERLLDLAAMLVLALIFLLQLTHYRWVMWASVILVMTGFVLLTVRWEAVIAWLKVPHSMRFVSRAAKPLATIFTSARALLEWRTVLVALLIGVLAWGLEGCGFAVLAMIRPPGGIELTAALGIYATAILVGALSFLPGGLGTTEAVMAALLVARGYSLADAVLIALVCRVVTLWFAIGLGWLALIPLRTRLVPQVPV